MPFFGRQHIHFDISEAQMIPIDRYGHCNFTLDEALGAFTLMLLYAGDWDLLSTLQTSAQAQQPGF